MISIVNGVKMLNWTQVACLTILAMSVLKGFFIMNAKEGETRFEGLSEISKSRIVLMMDTTYERMAMRVYALIFNVCLSCAAFQGWFKSFQAHPEIDENRARCGFALAVISMILHVYAHVSLGTNWSGFVVALQNHKLVTTGAYRLARHPMYLAYIMHCTAVYLMSQNYVVAGLMAYPVLFAFSRIPREETLMVELFGQEYIDYHEQVGALWPWKVKHFDLGLSYADLLMGLRWRDSKKTD